MKFWQEHELDLIVCPGFGCHAYLQGKASDLGLARAYVIVWNVLDMVAGSLPVTTVKEDELHYESDAFPLDGHGSRSQDRRSNRVHAPAKTS